MRDGIDTVFAILTAIIGVAIVSVIVSKNSQTPQVLQSFASAFANILGVVVKPIARSGGAQGNGGGGLGGQASPPVINIGPGYSGIQ